MENMQAFYTRLSLSESVADAYWNVLRRISRMSLEQAKSFRTLITWDNWA